MSAASQAQRQRFNVSGGEERGGIRMDATVSGVTGDFDIEVEVSGVTFIPGPEVASNDIQVRVRPANATRLRNFLNRLPGDLSGRVGISRTFLSSAINPQIPRPSDFEFTDTIPAGTVFPETFNYDIPRFPPVVVPDVGNVRDRIPEVEIDVTLTPTGFFGFGGGVFSDLPSTTLTLPATAFVDFVDVDDFGCDEVFSNVESRLDELQQRIPSLSDVRSDLRQLESIRSEVTSRTGVSDLRNLDVGTIAPATRSNIQDWRNRVREIPENPIPRGETVSSLRRTADNIRDEIQDIPGACSNNFGRRLDDLTGQLGELENLVNRLQSLREQLLDNIPSPGILSGVPCRDQNFGPISGESIDIRLNNLEDRSSTEIDVQEVSELISDIQDIPEEEGGECINEFLSRARAVRSRVQQDVAELGCQDIPRYIRNAVAGAQSEARQLTRARAVSLTPGRISSVRATIEDARETVEDNAPDENPCKDQLLGRLDSAEATVRRATPEDVEALSCEARFETINSRLESFEDDVLSVEPPVSAEQFELFASRADNIINNIEEDIPEGDRCRRDFIRRVNGALNRVGRVGARARIITELSDEQIAERQQIIEDLRSRLQRIEDRRGR